jgi:hypothetical protein
MMTFKNFIETKYDVRERIADLKSNPLKSFIDSDIFPCDFVDVENGEMVKMLYYANGAKDIAVLDLLSYRREDLVRLKDQDLLDLYDTYTEQFDFDDSMDLTKLSSIREESLTRKRNGNS